MISEHSNSDLSELNANSAKSDEIIGDFYFFSFPKLRHK